MAAGRAVTVVPLDTEMTTGEAAELRIAEEERGLRGVGTVGEQMLADVALAAHAGVVPKIHVVVDHPLRHEPIGVLRQLVKRRTLAPARRRQRRARLG